MSFMDGFEFLESFLLLKPRIGKIINIYIVSLSISVYDIERIAKISDVTDFIVKLMTKLRFEKIVHLLAEDKLLT